jgi:hypothetical protein
VTTRPCPCAQPCPGARTSRRGKPPSTACSVAVVRTTVKDGLRRQRHNLAPSRRRARVHGCMTGSHAQGCTGVRGNVSEPAPRPRQRAKATVVLRQTEKSKKGSARTGARAWT